MRVKDLVAWYIGAVILGLVLFGIACLLLSQMLAYSLV